MQEDFKGYCAYCGVHESEWPHAAKNYQLDHFKPKGNALFKALENDFYNLRWCCHICNRADAKGETWPSATEESRGESFVDLCQDDWTRHYNILPDGKLEALTNKATYTIRIIGLNDRDYVRHRLQILARGGSLFQSSG